MNAPTQNSPRTPQDFDPGTLTPRDQATLELLGSKLVEGYSEKELAKELQVEHSWVSQKLHEVRTAIGLQQGLFPPLTEAEEEALTGSIIDHGVLHPVIVDENLATIDGANRVRLAKQVGQEDTLRYILKRGLTQDQKEDLAFTLNASRRQLDIATRKKLVEYQLNRDPMRSNPVIAALCGVSADTVQAVRNDLTAQAAVRPSADQVRAAAIELEPALVSQHVTTTATPAPTVKHDPPVRLDSVGRLQPAHRAPRERTHDEIAMAGIVHSMGSLTGTNQIECPHCGTALHIYGKPGDYRLTLTPAA